MTFFLAATMVGCGVEKLIMRSQILNLITIIMVNKLKQENGSKFTIIKYHINATD